MDPVASEVLQTAGAHPGSTAMRPGAFTPLLHTFMSFLNLNQKLCEDVCPDKIFYIMNVYIILLMLSEWRAEVSIGGRILLLWGNNVGICSHATGDNVLGMVMLDRRQESKVSESPICLLRNEMVNLLSCKTFPQHLFTLFIKPGRPFKDCTSCLLRE